MTVIILILILVIYFSISIKQKRSDSCYHIIANQIINNKFSGYRLDKEILVKNDKIVLISNNIKTPSGCEIVRLPESTIIPGLIDTHTHILFFEKNYDINFSTELVRSDREDGKFFRFACAILRARSYLEAGITTVRDLGNSGYFWDVKLKKMIDSGIVEGPRMYVSGPGIATRYGQFPSDTPKSTVLKEYQLVETNEDVESQVELHMRSGTDLIKVYANNSPGEGAISFDLLSKIVSYSHQKGLKVAAHAEFDEEAKKAAIAGVDSIEHGYELSESTLSLMASNKIFLVPTYFSKQMYSFIFENTVPGKHRYSPYLIDYVFKKREWIIRKAIQAGVPIAFGSDMYFHLQSKGESIGRFSKDTLVAYSELGLLPEEILRMATQASANLVDNSKKLGIIEEGAIADIIALNGDPIKDIRSINQVSFVMKNGIMLKKTCIYCSLLGKICK